MNLNYFLLVIGSISLSLTFLLTTFSFKIKILGAINDINAKSWNLASAVTLLNSLFIAIALAIIAFFLDTFPNLYFLIIFFLANTLIVFFGHVFMFYKLHSSYHFIKYLTDIYFTKNLLTKGFKQKFTNYSFDLFSFIAWFSFLIGFIFPTFLAVFFNEYRATLFQLSFVFNSFGTLITIVITDKKASLLADKISYDSNKELKITDYLSLVLINRIYASLLVLLILLLIFIIL